MYNLKYISKFCGARKVFCFSLVSLTFDTFSGSPSLISKLFAEQILRYCKRKILQQISEGFCVCCG